MTSQSIHTLPLTSKLCAPFADPHRGTSRKLAAKHAYAGFMGLRRRRIGQDLENPGGAITSGGRNRHS
jgi:hypothetical protein